MIRPGVADALVDGPAELLVLPLVQKTEQLLLVLEDGERARQRQRAGLAVSRRRRGVASLPQTREQRTAQQRSPTPSRCSLGPRIASVARPSARLSSDQFLRRTAGKIPRFRKFYMINRIAGNAQLGILGARPERGNRGENGPAAQLSSPRDVIERAIVPTWPPPEIPASAG